MWVNKEKPRKLKLNDSFLVGNKMIFKVMKINNSSSFFQLECCLNEEIIKIAKETGLFVVGSHKKCNLVVKEMMEFELIINVAKM